jgi:hypothetical protein
MNTLGNCGLPSLSAAGTSSSSVVTTQGVGYSSSASKTRPNDTNAYAALDVIAEATSGATVWTFSNIGPSGGGQLIIDAIQLRIDVAAIPSGMGGFRLHLYSTSPTAIDDNAAYNLPSADRGKYLGFAELTTPLDLGDTLWSASEEQFYQIRKQVTAASGTLYGILQTINAYTPTASAVYTVSLHAVGV